MKQQATEGPDGTAAAGLGGVGRAPAPRQMRTGGMPLAPLGMSDSGSAVRLSLERWTPLGRGHVRLQWQVAPLGVPFDAPAGVISGVSAGWDETHGGTRAGERFVQDVTGLSPQTAYHWRVRVLYEPGNRLGQAAGPWLHVPWNGWSELDFRTPVAQVYLPVVQRNN
ncbi:MAG: hypothetical protein JXA93_05225 [Anaerolineae bacterium]|nr:hypothetical protein [Anaerolineae bacterium]